MVPSLGLSGDSEILDSIPSCPGMTCEEAEQELILEHAENHRAPNQAKRKKRILVNLISKEDCMGKRT
jgi:hypothetical protein